MSVTEKEALIRSHVFVLMGRCPPINLWNINQIYLFLFPGRVI
jgi:hypothetical protein